MWTEPLPNGKYKAVERYMDPITGKQKKVSCVIERDTRMARKEAQKKLDEKIEAILGKTDYDKMTLRELCELYMENYDGKESSKYSVETVVNRIINKIGSARVNHLTASYVMISAKDEPTTTYNNSIKRLKSVITWGYKHDYVSDKTWIDKLQLKPDNQKERIEDKYLEQDELEKLLQSMKACQHWQLLTKFLALSGLRIGEALALTTNDVDAYIHIHRTLQTNIGIIADTPKTEDSNREVFVQPELGAVIKEIKSWRLEEMMRTKKRTELLFVKLPYKSYIGYLKRKSQIILNKTVTPHTLRHTHASLLAASGVSLDAISRRLGHSNSTITRDVYFHVTEKLKEKEEAEMAKIKLL